MIETKADPKLVLNLLQISGKLSITALNDFQGILKGIFLAANAINLASRAFPEFFQYRDTPNLHNDELYGT